VRPLLRKLRSNWVAALTLTLAALLFLLPAVYMSYRSLWFQHAAARANGSVVETADDGSLTVEYVTRDEQVLRAETGGSDYYKGYARGDRLTVFYDPRNAQDARVDLWLEHWILPLLVAIPGLLMMLTMLLILSQL
jgi:hypothetical protein